MPSLTTVFTPLHNSLTWIISCSIQIVLHPLNIETEQLSGWLTQSSLETLKTSFNVCSEDQARPDTSHPHYLCISVNKLCQRSQEVSKALISLLLIHQSSDSGNILWLTEITLWLTEITWLALCGRKPPVTGGFPSKGSVQWSLWFLCLPAEQTGELPVIQDTMMLKWHHFNEKPDHLHGALLTPGSHQGHSNTKRHHTYSPMRVNTKFTTGSINNHAILSCNFHIRPQYSVYLISCAALKMASLIRSMMNGFAIS